MGNGQGEEHTLVGDSPYSVLSEDIVHYSTLGEVLLMGDFNARTQNRQCEIYDMEDPEMMLTMTPEGYRDYMAFSRYGAR